MDDLVHGGTGARARSPSTTITGAPTQVPIEIVDDICNEGDDRFECSLLTTTTEGSNVESQTFEATVTTQAPPDTSPPTTAATDPPATDPPATDPPATDPPATDPPATDPPTTEGTTATTAAEQNE